MTPVAGLRCCLPLLLALTSCQTNEAEGSETGTTGESAPEFDIEGVHVYGTLEFGRGKWGCFPCEDVRVHVYRGANGWVLLDDAPPEAVEPGQIASATADEFYVLSKVPAYPDPWVTQLWRWSPVDGWTAPWDTIGPMTRLRAASASPTGEIWATDNTFLARWDGEAWGLVETVHQAGALECWENPGSTGCACGSGLACAEGLSCDSPNYACCEEGSTCERTHDTDRFGAMHAGADYFWVDSAYGTLRFDGSEWLVDSESESVLGILGTEDGSAYVGASRNFYAPSQRVIEPAQLEPLPMPLVERKSARGAGSLLTCGYVKLAGSATAGVMIEDQRWESPDDVVPGCGIPFQQTDWFDGTEWVSIEPTYWGVTSLETLEDGRVLRSTGSQLAAFDQGAWQKFGRAELSDVLRSVDPLGDGRLPTDTDLHAIFLPTPELD